MAAYTCFLPATPIRVATWGREPWNSVRIICSIEHVQTEQVWSSMSGIETVESAATTVQYVWVSSSWSRSRWESCAGAVRKSVEPLRLESLMPARPFFG
ncbi:hypothetical protein SAMN05443574_11635 [Haloarcula vallismortis]|uniref:Uncharacterized protein n=1 Tax=Haloarcula vallismortis TaxID=28442 RepID=A0A1H2ZEA7_HALVA|nr:hypothetical protein SAMN05443574_11635 [Haloarcula vallismortis]